MSRATRIRWVATALLFLLAIPFGVGAAEEPERHLVEASWCPYGDRAVLLFSLAGAAGDSVGEGGSPLQPKPGEVGTVGRKPSRASAISRRSRVGYELWLVSGSEAPRTVCLETSSARLLGWTAEGEGAIVDQGPGRITVFPAQGGPTGTILLPEAAVCLASDGVQAYYLSEDGRHLLSVDGDGQTRVVTSLPPGVRPPGALSADGRCLALRRSVRQGGGTGARWGTEIWVVERGSLARAISVDRSLVRVAWHPERTSLLLNSPLGTGLWTAQVVEKGPEGWELTSRHEGLPSPLQWDRSGRLYAADPSGLLEVHPDLRRLRDWSPSGGRLMLWAVAPSGKKVLAGLEEDGRGTRILVFPLPSGEGVPLLSRASGAGQR